MTTTAALLPLAGVRDAAGAGGKARNLSHLIACGHPVPDGSGITDAALTS
jgi:hypothetical protein